MAHTITTDSSQLVPLGFCRIIATVIRRILKEEKNQAVEATEPQMSHSTQEDTRPEEPTQ